MPAPSGSAYHLDFRANEAYQGSTLLGDLTNLLSGSTLRLSSAGLEVQNTDNYLFDSAVASIVGDGVGSIVVGALSTTSVTDGRVVGSNAANNQCLLNLRATATDIGAWNGGSSLIATFGSGDDNGPWIAAYGFSGASRSLVVNNGTVATASSVALNQAVGSLYFGGDGGFNPRAVGVYEFITFYDSKLDDATLKGLTSRLPMFAHHYQSQGIN